MRQGTWKLKHECCGKSCHPEPEANTSRMYTSLRNPIPLLSASTEQIDFTENTNPVSLFINHSYRPIEAF